MSDAKERLFRDDAGAALERAVRLEEENAELRAEVDRLKRLAETAGPPPPAPPNAPSLRPGTALPAVAIALVAGSALLVTGLTCKHSKREAPHVFVMSTADQGQQATPPNGPVLVDPATTGCSPPFTYDAQGHKRFKRHCLK